MARVQACGCCCPLVLLAIVGMTVGLAALGIRAARVAVADPRKMAPTVT